MEQEALDDQLAGPRRAMDEQTAGFSVRAMAGMFNVSASTIQRDITNGREAPDEFGMIQVGRTMGLDGKLRPNRRFDTTERNEAILKMHGDNVSMRKIAETVGCSVGTVHRVVKAL